MTSEVEAALMERVAELEAAQRAMVQTYLLISVLAMNPG